MEPLEAGLEGVGHVGPFLLEEGEAGSVPGDGGEALEVLLGVAAHQLNVFLGRKALRNKPEDLTKVVRGSQHEESSSFIFFVPVPSCRSPGRPCLSLAC